MDILIDSMAVVHVRFAAVVVHNAVEAVGQGKRRMHEMEGKLGYMMECVVEEPAGVCRPGHDVADSDRMTDDDLALAYSHIEAALASELEMVSFGSAHNHLR